MFWILLKKDLALEFRKKELFAGLTMCCILISFIFIFAINSLQLESDTKLALGTVAVFISGLLSGVLSIERSLKSDFQNKALERLVVMRCSMLSFYLAKCAYNFIFVLFGFVISFGFISASLTSGPWSTWLPVLGLALPCSIAISALLSLLAGITYNSRLGGLLLAIIGLPLLMPLLAFVTELAIQIALTGSFNPASVSYNFVLGLLAFYLLLGINLAEYVYRN